MTNTYPPFFSKVTSFCSFYEDEDSVQLLVSDEELDAVFPSSPPPSPVDKKKLPFIDTVHFFIPKQSDIKDKINSKRCVKHHSVLCKICPIITG